MIKQAYLAGVRAALTKMGVEDTRSSPYTLSYQQPSSRPEGRQSMISQAFARNESLGNPSEGNPAATNNILKPGLPPVQQAEARHFGDWSTDMGGDAFPYESGLR